MKKRTNNGMRDDYDFSKGRRGKYARRYAEGTNVIVLEPDVAKAVKKRYDSLPSQRTSASRSSLRQSMVEPPSPKAAMACRGVDPPSPSFGATGC